MKESYVLRTKDTKQWHDILEGLPARAKSVYDTPEYLRVFEKIYGFQGELFVYRDDENDEFAAYPYLVRGFDTLEDFTGKNRKRISNCNYRDIISTWYYGGAMGRIDEGFFRAFHDYCRDENIVTEFARLNPYTVDQRNYPSSEYNRDVVWVDLPRSHFKYERRCRKAFRQAERNGVEISSIGGKTHRLEEFAELYSLDMEEKDASPFHRFSVEFFKALFEGMGKHATLFLAFKDNVMIAGTIVLHRYHIVQDYLRGSQKKYLKFRPNNLLIHRQIEWAKESGYSIYDLGGGMTRPTADGIDGLFVFKKAFSELRKPFHVWKKVHDERAYSNLVEMRESHSLPISRQDYFPLYREGLGEIG